MKPIKWGIAVLSAVVSLSGCVGFWDRHPGVQSGPIPDQAYWTDRTWRLDVAERQREEQRALSRMRLQEFIR
jgi:hypothetical protein